MMTDYSNLYRQNDKLKEVMIDMISMRSNIENSIDGLHLFWKGHSAQAFDVAMEQWLISEKRIELDIESLADEIKLIADKKMRKEH